VALEHAVAAPLCTRQLADLGADVIKVERPGGGDFARAYDSVVHGESAYFVWLNYGKRSVSLDLTTDRGRQAFDALLDSADVFVQNLGPGAVDRLGYGWESFHARWPAIVSCSISGYGAGGPSGDQKAFDLLLQGESGLLSVTGTAEAMARVGISIADICAATNALAAILAALLERHRSGVGRQIDISMLEGLADWMTVPALHARHGFGAPPRSGLHHPGIAPYGPYATSDGRRVLIAIQTARQWERFCETVLAHASIAAEPRFADNEARVEHRGALDALIEEALQTLDRDALITRLEEADVPYGNVNSVADLIDHPQLRARNRWRTVETQGGDAVVARSVLGDGAGGRVPRAGEDTAAVLGELGLDG
jgi:itaconate CoA-transferase